jgi:hypothetical protein
MLLKKTHILRCAQSPHVNALLKYASVRRFIARLGSETFLSSLKAGFFITCERHLANPFSWYVFVLVSETLDQDPQTQSR